MSIFEELKAGVACRTPEDTIALATRFGSFIPCNQVVALSGDLGAGKTTFSKGIGEALGIEQATITSPTFNIYSIYQGSSQLIHIDAYRLSGSEAIESLMIEEFVKDPWLILVEWPERGLAEWMTEILWKIVFKRNTEGETVIQLVEYPLSHDCLK